jgi:hypothetical protein
MTKPTIAIVLGVLALGVGTFSTAQKTTTNPPATWTVVGVTALNNMTETVNQTLFTPLTTGVYRVTYYSSGFTSGLTISYTNGVGGLQSITCGDCLQGSGGDASLVKSFQAKSGTPVSLEVYGAGFPYSASITVERLETATP